ncbi:NADP-dependent oxidoreductase [Actinoplanes sp. NPDC051494]|uniref:NADP-dependent oxidoreductase n=1 Tax=Actinoplanes sp. NPDC051494 TaxID=3363907 RepID=UPI0037BA90EA
MRAARIYRYGDPGVIRVEELDLPVAGDGEVLIKVAATSMNPTEAALRSGALAAFLPVTLPVTLGWDVAGEVAGVPMIGRLDRGAAAEFAVVPAGRLVPAPVSVPLADAAALPLAGLTAWQAVVEHARVRAGERVLINGAGGGIGGFAVQIAKHRGAYVIAASRGAARGADEVLDYTAGPLRPGEPVDAVVNCAAIGDAAAAALPALVRPGGRVVTVATPVPATDDVAAWHMVVRHDPAGLGALVALVDGEVIKLDITGRGDLTDLPELHRLAEGGGLRGKVVVTP